ERDAASRGRAEISDHKKSAEEEIERGKDEVRWMHALLENQGQDRNKESQFLENGWNHKGAEAKGIGGDEDECDLPDQSHASEPVKKDWMGDRRRIVPANQIEHEIERSDDEKAPDARNPEDDFCEFHEAFSRRRSVPDFSRIRAVGSARR